MGSDNKGLLASARELAASGDVAVALAHYATLCEKEPYNPDLWLERAGIAESSGHVAEAIEVLFHVTDMFARAGIAEAADLAERVLALDPNHTGAQQFLHRFRTRQLGDICDAVPEAVPHPIPEAVPHPIDDVPSSWSAMDVPLPAVDLPSGSMRISVSRDPGSGGFSVQFSDKSDALEADAHRRAVAELIDSLHSPLVNQLDDQARGILIDVGTVHHRRRHEAIFHQGDIGSSLYIVLEGKVDVESHDAHSGTIRRLATLRAGAFFGEVALLTGATRSATVRAASQVTLLKIARSAVRDLSARNDRLMPLLNKFFRARLVGTLMATSPIFEPLPASERRALITRFRLRELPADRVVLRQGRDGDGLYMVLVGRLVASIAGPGGRARTIGQLGPGDVFGEMSLLTGDAVMATIRSRERVWLLRLPKGEFERVTGAYPEVLSKLEAIAAARRDHNRETLQPRAGDPVPDDFF